MAIEPTLQELLEAAHDSRLLDVHVSLPGKVIDYDPTTQTATVQPVVKRPIVANDGSTVFEQIAPITNVRVAWPRGGGYSLQWPLSAGDHGELVFTQWDPSGWRENGEISEPALLQLHGLSQPWFWPGAGTSPLTPPVGDEAVFEIGTALRLGGLTADFVAIASKLQAYITQLETDIAAAFTAVGAGGAASGPNGATAFTGGSSTRAALTAAIPTVKLKAE